MVHNLSDSDSIIGNYLAELRDIKIQKDPMRFRANLERIAEIMAYEISRKLKYKAVDVETPLGIAPSRILEEQPVLITILRAGLAMHSGFLRYFDRAESAYVSAYRKHTTPEEFEIYVEYLAAPVLDNRIWIISDPMLATGGTLIMAFHYLIDLGATDITAVCILSAPEGIAAVEKEFANSRVPITIVTGALDEKLNEHGYIVPGLGDAGDRLYGVV